MQLRKTVVAIVLGLGFTAFAQAAKDLGELSTTKTLTGSGVVLTTGLFSNEYTFTVASALRGTVNVWSLDITPDFLLSDLTVSVYEVDTNGKRVLYEPALPGQTDFGNDALIANGSVVFDPAVANYMLVISGYAAGTTGGVFNVSMSATVVPEPAEYAMLLAGLGVVGMVARRRRMSIN